MLASIGEAVNMVGGVGVKMNVADDILNVFVKSLLSLKVSHLEARCRNLWTKKKAELVSSIYQ